jgi:hypothetical protein
VVLVVSWFLADGVDGRWMDGRMSAMERGRRSADEAWFVCSFKSTYPSGWASERGTGTLLCIMDR